MTNKIKPVEWEKKLSEIVQWYTLEQLWVMGASDRLMAEIHNKTYLELKQFISSLLQEQAEHFVELGEKVTYHINVDKYVKNIQKGNMDDVFDYGYKTAISDFQEAIRTASLQATLIKNEK